MEASGDWEVDSFPFRDFTSIVEEYESIGRVNKSSLVMTSSRSPSLGATKSLSSTWMVG